MASGSPAKPTTMAVCAPGAVVDLARGAEHSRSECVRHVIHFRQLVTVAKWRRHIGECLAALCGETSLAMLSAQIGPPYVNLAQLQWAFYMPTYCGFRVAAKASSKQLESEETPTGS